MEITVRSSKTVATHFNMQCLQLWRRLTLRRSASVYWKTTFVLSDVSSIPATSTQPDSSSPPPTSTSVTRQKNLRSNITAGVWNSFLPEVGISLLCKQSKGMILSHSQRVFVPSPAFLLTTLCLPEIKALMISASDDKQASTNQFKKPAVASTPSLVHQQGQKTPSRTAGKPSPMKESQEDDLESKDWDAM